MSISPGGPQSPACNHRPHLGLSLHPRNGKTSYTSGQERGRLKQMTWGRTEPEAQTGHERGEVRMRPQVVPCLPSLLNMQRGLAIFSGFISMLYSHCKCHRRNCGLLHSSENTGPIFICLPPVSSNPPKILSSVRYSHCSFSCKREAFGLLFSKGLVTGEVQYSAGDKGVKWNGFHDLAKYLQEACGGASCLQIQES